jgi:hypothetical protein
MCRLFLSPSNLLHFRVKARVFNASKAPVCRALTPALGPLASLLSMVPRMQPYGLLIWGSRLLHPLFLSPGPFLLMTVL